MQSTSTTTCVLLLLCGYRIRGQRGSFHESKSHGKMTKHWTSFGSTLFISSFLWAVPMWTRVCWHARTHANKPRTKIQSIQFDTHRCLFVCQFVCQRKFSWFVVYHKAVRMKCLWIMHISIILYPHDSRHMYRYYYCQSHMQTAEVQTHWLAATARIAKW